MGPTATTATRRTTCRGWTCGDRPSSGDGEAVRGGQVPDGLGVGGRLRRVVERGGQVRARVARGVLHGPRARPRALRRRRGAAAVGGGARDVAADLGGRRGAGPGGRQEEENVAAGERRAVEAAVEGAESRGIKANSKRASPMVSPLRDAAAAAAVPQMGDVMGSMSAPRPSPDEGAKPAAPAAAASAAAPDTEEEEETPPLPTSPTLAGVAGSILGSPQRLAAAAVNAAPAAPASMASARASRGCSRSAVVAQPRRRRARYRGCAGGGGGARGAPSRRRRRPRCRAVAPRAQGAGGGAAAARDRSRRSSPRSTTRWLETEDPRRSSVGHERWETPEQPRPPPSPRRRGKSARTCSTPAPRRPRRRGVASGASAPAPWRRPKQSSLNSTTSDDDARSTSKDRDCPSVIIRVCRAPLSQIYSLFAPRHLTPPILQLFALFRPVADSSLRSRSPLALFPWLFVVISS